MDKTTHSVIAEQTNWSPVGSSWSPVSTSYFGSVQDREIRLWYIAVVLVMVIIECIALFGNVIVMVVILKTPQLRTQLTYLFVLNLCVVDLLATLFVIPFSIAAYVDDRWPFSPAFCYANGFLSVFVSITSISSICVISIERYYSIRAPMHYAGHMTLSRTVSVILCVWLHAGFIAVLPLFGWNTYIYSEAKFHCTFVWSMEDPHGAYVVMLGVFAFVIPSVILMVMYCGIYKVARQTAGQVHPSPQEQVKNNQDGRDEDHITPKIDTPAKSPGVNTVSGTIELLQHSPLTSQTDVCATRGQSVVQPPKISSQSSTPPTQLPNQSHKSDKHVSRFPTFKAVKTLLLITVLFFVLWGPYFIVNMYGVFWGLPSTGPSIELAVTWLTFTAFAFNPFIYGWLNRTVREELIGMIWQCRLRFYSNVLVNDVEAETPENNENFMEFLERTSVTAGESTTTHAGKRMERRLSHVKEQ